MESWPSVDSRPVLTAPVSAASALFAAVRTRPGPFRFVKTVSSGAGATLETILTGRNGPGRARTVANRAGTAPMGGGEDRALVQSALRDGAGTGRSLVAEVGGGAEPFTDDVADGGVKECGGHWTGTAEIRREITGQCKNESPGVPLLQVSIV